MRSAENGFTTHFNIGKWNDGDNPGAAAINNNWDIIDNAIYTTLNIAVSAFTSSENPTEEPVYLNDSGSISLKYDTGSFAVVSGALVLTGSIAKGSGSFTGSFSGSFTGSVKGFSGSFTYVSSSNVITSLTGSFIYLSSSVIVTSLTGSFSHISSSGTVQAITGSFSHISSSGEIKSITGSFSHISSSGDVRALSGSFSYLTSSNMVVNSASFNFITSSINRSTTLVAYSASFNNLTADSVDILGVPHNFTINTSAEDVDVTLTFSRTTSGSAIFTWNGQLVQVNKAFKPNDIVINRISQSEPTTTYAGQVWLEVTP